MVVVVVDGMNERRSVEEPPMPELKLELGVVR
jgi:hypothetical protein